MTTIDPPVEAAATFAPDVDLEEANRWHWQPDPTSLRAQALSLSNAIKPASRDDVRTALLVIDMQRDFCFPEGSLFVAGRDGRGAVDDTARLYRFIESNLEQITQIHCTLDTHQPLQIFFSDFWQEPDGTPALPGRVVTAEQIEQGSIAPRPEIAPEILGPDAAAVDLYQAVLSYCRALEAQGRYQLFLWPEHCLLGGDGHALVGLLQQARLFHAWARRSPAPLISKGLAPLTEHYSVFGPEIDPERPQGNRRLADARGAHLIDQLLDYDRLFVAGQASSHCVLASVDDLVQAARERDSRLIRRIHVLTDCMSPVVLRDQEGVITVDFSSQAESAFERWSREGVQLCSSADAF